MILKPWHAAFVTLALTRSFKWSLTDPDLLLQQCHVGSCMGKRWNSGFVWFYCRLRHHSWFMQSTKWAYINTKGRGHLWTFVHESSDSVVLTFSTKTAGPIENKIYVEPLLDGEMKVCARDLGHVTKMTAILIYSKTLGKVSSTGWKANDLEIWKRQNSWFFLKLV